MPRNTGAHPSPVDRWRETYPTAHHCTPHSPTVNAQRSFLAGPRRQMPQLDSRWSKVGDDLPHGRGHPGTPAGMVRN